MKPFTVCEGYAAPLLRANIDTDMIIRIERIAQLSRGELGPWAFETWRYTKEGEPDPGFVLNRAPHAQASILIAGRNFGCGSSREMAVWALEECGIRCIIAPSFGDIFFNNCIQNGLLPVALPEAEVHQLAYAAEQGARMRVDLEKRLVTCSGVLDTAFTVAEHARLALLAGQDDIARTLEHAAEIKAFQSRDRVSRPWAYGVVSVQA
ncbi:3-isopropylmalate dehydratase small subunit [Pusillimonas sp. TS35]|jgi:3-isopropylmalate/(R)-2-methylmalate dehydratase small subunit|uniref:3-isopropylmalate dehydratase small subunit n=1 Tax=Paracandidimonas lactea TaxID=2895524 RepID=UPI00136FBE49|nr:3-isopropylmalate dehydratase small subunit [Paracandidimonas lactea]MYN11739.1 3-isopropylmalate dehydratase small subunit [Pusillimonas sp. TS35]